MNITTISYSESHEQFSEYGLKLWRKAGIEAELSEGDDPGKSYDELEKIVKARLTANQPPVIVPISQVEKSGAVRMEDAINSCTDMAVLVTYKLLVKGKPDLQDIYDKKVIELSK